jgi:hypothetical protein
MRRIVFVEDTYGKEFHRAVMRKLAESRVLNPPANIRIDPRPVRKCDNKLRRLVLSAAVSGEATKVLFVTDISWSTLIRSAHCPRCLFSYFSDLRTPTGSLLQLRLS